MADWHLKPDRALPHRQRLERDTLCQAIPELLIWEDVLLIAIVGNAL